MGILTPVMKDELSDDKKAIMSATSFTWPGRPNALMNLHLPITCCNETKH